MRVEKCVGKMDLFTGMVRRTSEVVCQRLESGYDDSLDTIAPSRHNDHRRIESSITAAAPVARIFVKLTVLD